MGWIEARKKCQQLNGLLLIVESREKKRILDEVVFSRMGRRRDEFWLAGNDIEEEGQWEWAKLRRPVSLGFGWIDSPYNSHEENCLAWSVEEGESHWQGAACCNNLRYLQQAILYSK